jgi:hypothetical protein
MTPKNGEAMVGLRRARFTENQSSLAVFPSDIKTRHLQVSSFVVDNISLYVSPHTRACMQNASQSRQHGDSEADSRDWATHVNRIDVRLRGR